MDHRELEEHYLWKKKEGMDYSDIRKELQHKGLSKDEINLLIRQIDDRVISGLHQKQKRSENNGTFIAGIFFLVIGCVLTFGSYFGWVDMGDHYIIAHGPIVTGIGLLLSSRFKRTKMFDRKHRFKSH